MSSEVNKIISSTFKPKNIYKNKLNKGNLENDELKEKIPMLHSLRNIDEDTIDQVDLDFQQCIAIKLAKSLDEELSMLLTPEITTVVPFKQIGGIKLLNSSQKFIKLKHSNIAKPMKRVKIKKRQFEESLEDSKSKCKVVAVDSDYILNKTEVQYWSNRSKAPVYHYKEQNGALVLQEAPFVSINYK